MAAVELVGALGCSWSIAREREQRRRRGSRARGGIRGSVVASPRMDRLEGEASSAKQEVAGVDARASSTQLLRGEGEEDDWQLGCTIMGRAGAGPVGGAR